MKLFPCIFLMLLVSAASANASVTVAQPSNGAAVSSPVQFTASGTAPTCSRGVASMGLYVNNVLQYVANQSNNINTTYSLAPGSYHVVLEEWDYCGGATYTPVNITVVNQTGVTVSSPANGSTVGSPVNFVATASTSVCSKGVASMGVYVDNSLQYVVNGNALNTSLPISPGNHHTVIQEWDYCGTSSYTAADINVTGSTGVHVITPTENSTVGTQTTYQATATTASCPQGVASMGVYVDNSLQKVQSGNSLNTSITLSPGKHHTVVQEWDYCGGSSYTPVDVNVTGSQGTTISSIQASGGWRGYGEVAPTWDICSSNCPGVSWSMTQHVQSPSLSGNATLFHLGGTHPYADVLWTNALIGQGTTQGIPDSNHTLLPTVHNFTYDTDIYITNWSITQNLEFDVNMYLNGAGMIWGTQCNHLASGMWDIWDNVNANWVPTTTACDLHNGWNHVTLQMQRQSNNDLLYQSITVNDVTHTINKTYAPFQVSQSWWGITVNYQMDGNYNQSANDTYLDNFSLTYW